jgi:uncharacterized peroxidase-related enzyme
VKIVKPENVDDPAIQEIFDWVTEMESAVPNHFYVEMNFPEFFKAKLEATKVLWQSGELAMPEIQHVGILVSKDNGCPYCTAAFCTIYHYGMGEEEKYVQDLIVHGASIIEDARTRTLVEYARKVNSDPSSITDQDTDRLREVGLSDKGIVQLVHVVSDFAAYNRLNLALRTDYDYRDLWRQLAFGWQPGPDKPSGDNSRGVR